MGGYVKYVNKKNVLMAFIPHYLKLPGIWFRPISWDYPFEHAGPAAISYLPHLHHLLPPALPFFASD